MVDLIRVSLIETFLYTVVLMNQLNEQIPGYLNRLIEAGITKKAVAESVGVSCSTVYRVLGKGEFSEKFYRLFAARYPRAIDRCRTGIPFSDLDVRYFCTKDQNVFVQAPDALVEAPNALVEAPNALVEAPDALVEAPDALVEAPDALVEAPDAPIVISYRGHLSEKDAKGILFDHMCLQRITNRATEILLPGSDEEDSKVQSLMRAELRNHPAALPCGDPSYVKDFSNSGLLLIPGRVRKNENEEVRENLEMKAIRLALLRGQPLLGICAGSWRVWEKLFMKQEAPINALVNAVDHTYTNMLRLNVGGYHVAYNVQIHDVELQESQIAQIAKEERFSVNSVHWKAPNRDEMPPNTRIAALSKKNLDIKQMTRCQKERAPEEDLIEAFETVHGAPVVGISWHLEGYDADSPHGRILLYLAKAGSAYAAKRRVLKELEARFTQ